MTAMTEPLRVHATGLFRRDLKRLSKRGLDVGRVQGVLRVLAAREELPTALRDHPLTGNFRDYRECHVAPDWLLIYRVVETDLVLVAFRTGTHADRF